MLIRGWAYHLMFSLEEFLRSKKGPFGEILTRQVVLKQVAVLFSVYIFWGLGGPAWSKLEFCIHGKNKTKQKTSQ